jgi:uncharacterized membrane protein
MKAYLAAYGAAAVVFLGLDAIWLNIASRLFYRPLLGDLLAEKPNLAVAVVFYAVYVIGVVVFCVAPAKTAAAALGLGALLGLVAYGTYDFTNLATIRNWPAIVSLVDLAWGMSLTALAALAGYAVLRWMS